MTPTPEASAGLDILADLTPRNGIPGACGVILMRRERPDLAVQLDRALAANRLPDRKIAEWITDKGFPLGHQTVARHRRRECASCKAAGNVTAPTLVMLGEGGPEVVVPLSRGASDD